MSGSHPDRLPTEDWWCHGIEWSENILSGGRHIITGRPTTRCTWPYRWGGGGTIIRDQLSDGHVLNRHVFIIL